MFQNAREWCELQWCVCWTCWTKRRLEEGELARSLAHTNGQHRAVHQIRRLNGIWRLFHTLLVQKCHVKSILTSTLCNRLYHPWSTLVYTWCFLQQSTLTHLLFHTLSGPLDGVLLHSPHSENVFPIPVVFSCARIEADSNVLMNWTIAITHWILIIEAHRVGIITKEDGIKWVVLLLGILSIHSYPLPIRNQCTVNNHITRSNWPILFFN